MVKRNAGFWSVIFTVLLSELFLLVSTLQTTYFVYENNQELIDEKKETPENDTFLKKILPLRCIKVSIDSENANAIKNFRKITIYHSDHIIPVFIPPPNITM